MEKYSCPLCGWKPPLEGVYIVDNRKIEKIKLDDINKLLDDEKFYPIMLDIKTEIIDNLFEGTSWTEVHYCPKCEKEFSFENANY